MRGVHLRQLWPVLASAALAVSLAACTSGSSASNPTAASGPELTSITVGVLSDADAIPAQIAIDEGFFKQEGLSVHLIVLTTTNQATPALLSHTLDFSIENYVGMFQQENTVHSLNLRVVADNDQGTPGLNDLMVAKDSPITSLSQLRGKKVGYPAPGLNLGALSTDVLLQPYHLTTGDFTTVVVPFPDDPQAIARGEVDVAYTTEPFVTIMKENGARVLADTLSGPLAGFPVTCWATDAAFVAKYPKTVAAFQAAIQKATRLAASDTPLVRQELPKFIKTMSPKLASVITLPDFNSTLSLARMQRVVNTMIEIGGLPANFDVNVMYDPPSATS
jgi:NitT/TauT family transport system substrate-binding protein